ncbi:MAG: HlyC/CorC family transporter [Planctomycetes bacterium]|nr:HlyC/CorC family transporter [Planctomycetota bacterium]
MVYFPYYGLALLAASVLLSVLSHAFRAYSTSRLEQRLSDADRIDSLERFLDSEESLAQTVAIWRILANAALVAVVVAYLLSESSIVHWIVGGLLIVLALLVFSVAVPIACARYNSEWIIVRFLPLMYALRAASAPLLRILAMVDTLVRRLSGVSETDDPDQDIEDELRSLVKEGELEGTLELDEKEMIENIIEFKDTDVAAIMTPRTEMEALPRTATLPAARVFVTDAGHSRVPVYEENLDAIVGVLYAKDLLAATGTDGFSERQVGDLMREVLFIPETKKLSELLHQFRNAGLHIAIVLDEYGGTAGLVTIEDIIEEILGEIVDEYDESEPDEIHRVSETAAEVDARARINEVNDELEIDLPEDEDYDTLGGFVLAKAGRIPKTGERIECHGLVITVLEADERKIARLRISRLDQFDRSHDA